MEVPPPVIAFLSTKLDQPGFLTRGIIIPKSYKPEATGIYTICTFDKKLMQWTND
jgi:hypothetical protein